MGNSFVVAPCKDCSERFIGCHGQENGRHRCEEYGEYCELMQQERNAQSKFHNEVDNYKRFAAQRWNRELVRNKKRRSFQ